MLHFLSGRENVLWAVLVTLIAILAFANTLTNDFVWADRTVILEENAILHSGSELFQVFTKPLWAFTASPMTGEGGYYRPIVAISYTIDHLLFGENPAGYHAGNVLLHAANSLLLFLFLALLFPGSRVPLFASLLFAVHPVHAEAVAWISGRTGLLATGGILLSLYLYARSGRNGILYSLSLLAFLFALGSKESGVVLPFLVLLARRQTRAPGEPFFRWTRESPYFVLLLLYAALRWTTLGSLGTGNAQTIEPALLIPTMLRVLGGYTRLLFLPFSLHTNDAVRISTSPFDPSAFLSLVAIGALLYGFIRLGRVRKETGFGLAWFGIAMLPFLNFAPLLHFRAERLLYLPSAGFVIAAAVLLDRWGGKIVGERKRFGFTPGEIVTAALVLILGFGTVARNKVWCDDHTLFSDTLRKNSYAPEALYMLGSDAYRHGAYREAIDLTSRSLALDNEYVAFLPVPWAYSNLGYSFYKLGMYVEADRAFNEALRVFPGMEKSVFGLALSLGAQERHEDAARLYKALATRNPEHENAHYNLALEYEALDSLHLAEEEYKNVIALNPDRKEAHMNLGSLLGRQGRFQDALDSYRSAIYLSPADPRIHFNIGLVFVATGNREGAMQALRAALRLDPDYTDAERLLEEVVTLEDPDTNGESEVPPPE